MLTFQSLQNEGVLGGGNAIGLRYSDLASNPDFQSSLFACNRQRYVLRLMGKMMGRNKKRPESGVFIG